MDEIGPDHDVCDRFLITGCQRSGTTLVGMILEAHPSIEYRGRERHTVSHAGAGHAGAESRRRDAAPRRSDGGLVGYKGPRDSHRVAEIAAAWPHGRVVWVERPIRQVVASMLALKSDGGRWATRFAPREITKHIERTGDARVRRWSPAPGRVRGAGLRKAARPSSTAR
jgi:hypothetical protein